MKNNLNDDPDTPYEHNESENPLNRHYLVQKRFSIGAFLCYQRRDTQCAQQNKNKSVYNTHKNLLKFLKKFDEDELVYHDLNKKRKRPAGRVSAFSFQGLEFTQTWWLVFLENSCEFKEILTIKK
jgi:hypothetical protein